MLFTNMTAARIFIGVATLAISFGGTRNCFAFDDQTITAEEKKEGEPLDWKRRFWVSGQINSITQYHPTFQAKYSGDSSIQPESEMASSRVLTLFTGFRLTRSTEVFVDIESAGGSGLSSALGMAGFTNLDVVRNPTLGSKPYLGRYLIRQVIGLSKEKMEQEASPLGLATELPVRRIELRFGKLSTADFLDLNSVGSDSHLQFMNWTVDNNGAYDYAADTRGYTYGALIEYYDRKWTLRFMEGLMPTVANGLTLDWSVGRARSENVELELHRNLLPGKETIVRLLGYANHANMGSYRESIAQYQDGQVDQPSIENTRQQGRLKYGFGVNVEQPLTPTVTAFGRWGWNEGKNESYAYTEVNETIAAGARFAGSSWHRTGDAAGVAFVSNAISGDHRRYLELGGQGFLLGDGGLNYGRENIFEAYYRWHLRKGISLSPDIQRVMNPGYNRDRGPVFVAGLRLHIDIDSNTLRGMR